MAHSNRRRLCGIAVIAYWSITLVLGLRIYLPAGDAFCHGTSWGAYNMFSARVELDQQAWLSKASLDSGESVGAHAKSIRLSRELLDGYFWLNPLISTTHSHLQPESVEQFAAFLASRPEIVELAGDDGQWEVTVQVRYRRNRGPWREVIASRTLENNASRRARSSASPSP